MCGWQIPIANLAARAVLGTSDASAARPCHTWIHGSHVPHHQPSGRDLRCGEDGTREGARYHRSLQDRRRGTRSRRKSEETASQYRLSFPMWDAPESGGDASSGPRRARVGGCRSRETKNHSRPPRRPLKESDLYDDILRRRGRPILGGRGRHARCRCRLRRSVRVGDNCGRHTIGRSRAGLAHDCRR